MAAVEEGTRGSGEGLPGLVVPGLANVHSHAFHRALRARTESGAATFWQWRERMYEVASRLDPDSYLRLARGVYAEMALAGVTAVGEFHYVHHAPGGSPYENPNEMGEALMQAAAETGIRITLLDTCYLSGGFGEPLSDAQRRFGDVDAATWAERVARLKAAPAAKIGAAIHSVRAVPGDEIGTVASWARANEAPLHFHVSEQQAENDACIGATGATPIELLEANGALSPTSTAIHATHVTPGDIERLGSARTGVCLCPTTERSLADGVGPASALRGAGCSISVGSDSHAVVDLFEEARAIELDERLVSGERGRNDASELFAAVTSGGMRSLGWEAGAIAEGQICDLVSIDIDSPRMAGYSDESAAAWVVFGATAADVTHVVASGETIVSDGRHLAIEDVAHELVSTIAEVNQE